MGENALTDIFRSLGQVKVIDLSQYIPGPYTTQILADLGADVIKIECPPYGDPLRQLFKGKSHISSVYSLYNASKRILFLNLTEPEDSSFFCKLADKADVLLEGFRPKVMDRLCPALSEIAPNLIHCSISGWGSTGPDASKGGHDIGYLARTGFLSTNESLSSPFPPVADHVSSLYAVIAILAALQVPREDRTYTRIDTSIFEAGLALQKLAMGLPKSDRLPDQGLLNGGAACYRLYRTRDGRRIAVGAIEPKFWEQFCKTVGKAEWIHRQVDPLPQTELINEVTALFEDKSLNEWMDIFSDVDSCLEPVIQHEEVLNDPQVTARGMCTCVNGNVLFPAIVNGSTQEPRQIFREIKKEDVDWLN